ncbi:MAG: hypothetical protein QCI82_03475 [Candidatus Thermoplasmatota archaeon]|nr:hypothetical protein [Candidatus Thermoplasmatota archaeon]
MALKIPVPGMDQFLCDIPDGSMLVMSGGFEGTQSFLAQSIGYGAYKSGREVTYVTSRAIPDIMGEVMRFEPGVVPFYLIENVPLNDWRTFISSKCVLIVDSYSLLVMNVELPQLRDGLMEIKTIAKERGATLVLVAHPPLIDERRTSVTEYFADSLVEFRSQEEDEFVRRYLRVHKWYGTILEQLIYYRIDEGRMEIDLRARIV